MSTESPEILKYRDVDKGKIGFVLSGGPSLKLLSDFPRGIPAIVVNEASLRVPWAKYACTMDSTVYKYMWNIQWQGMGAMIPHIFTNHVTAEEESGLAINLETRPGFEYCFSLDPSKWVYNIDSPAYIALQLALYFGWEETYLLGVDHTLDPENGDTHYYGKKKEYFGEMEMEFQLGRAGAIFTEKIRILRNKGYKIFSCSPYSRLNLTTPYVPLDEAIANAVQRSEEQTEETGEEGLSPE